jgi:hypothetical protein
MGGMSAARANISGTRTTIQPMIPRKRNQERGRPHKRSLVPRAEQCGTLFLSAEALSLDGSPPVMTSGRRPIKRLCCLPPLSCA